MASNDAASRRWRLIAGLSAASAAALAALGWAAPFALASLVTLPQRDRPYGWLTDRLLLAAGHGLLILAALVASIAVIAWLVGRRRLRA